MPSAIAKVRDYFRQRQLAYKRLFDTNNADAKRVLKDLGRFCRADKPTFHENERLHALMEGRREVWLRIMTHLKTPTHEFVDKFGGIDTDPQGDINA